MNFGLVIGCPWRSLSLGIFVLRAQFQCRLFLMVQALIFGAQVVLLVLSCGLFASCLGVLPGLFLALSVLIIADFVLLGGRSAVMVLLLGLVRAASELLLTELLGLFRYPPESGRALLAGTLPHGYCAARFACSTRTWRLPVSGHVVDLVTACVGAVREDIVAGADQKVHWVSGSGLGRKRIRQNRKTPAHLAGCVWFNSRPSVWKRLRHVGFSNVSIPDHKRRRGDQDNEGCNPASPGLHDFLNRLSAVPG